MISISFDMQKSYHKRLLQYIPQTARNWQLGKQLTHSLYDLNINVHTLETIGPQFAAFAL